MLDCADVLNCILTSPEIQQVIATYAGSSNITINTTENASNLSSELVNNPAGCDNDIIFGMCVQLVEFADRLIKDLFENLSASQLSSENVGFLIKLIPVVETLPLDEAFELAGKLVEDMETAYLSASTELLKDQIACDLFCIAIENGCVLTLENVRDYYQEQAGVVFDYSDVFSFLVDFINGTFIGNAVFYGMNILFFQIFVFGGRFLEYFYKDYLRTIQSMFNDPNPDWATICDDCPSFIEIEYDFTVDDGGWNVEPRDGSGWNASYNTTNGWFHSASMSISKDSGIGEGIRITNIEFTGTPDRQYSLGFFNSAGYPNTEISADVTTDGSGIGTASVNWIVPADWEPFVRRSGTVNYRQITYLKYSGYTI